MTRMIAMMAAALAVATACTGCTSRMIKEGMGVVTGASGKFVDGGILPNLAQYRAATVEPISVAPDVQVPAEMPEMVRTDFTAAAVAQGLALEGRPALTVSGEIIHYETAGMVDSAIGPLAEVIVRAKLTDAQTGKVIAHANLVGRSKATMSSGAKDLSAGLGKALSKWLKEGGLRKPEEQK